MPRLSCWLIKASLLHLAVGVGMGALILSAKGMPALFGWSWLLLPAHIQLLVGGWLLQLALGVAFWILPRLNGAGERGRVGWAWISFGALNLGVAGAAIVLPIWSLYRADWLAALLGLAALLQLVAIGAFIWHVWPRLQSAPAALRWPA
jgi:hypothetical protein